MSFDLHEWIIIIVDSIIIPAVIAVYSKFRKMEKTSERNEEEIQTLRLEVRELEGAISDLEKNRSKDVLAFTEILGKINITLAELKTTIHHLNDTLTSLKDQQDHLSNRIDDIYKKI